MILFGLVLMLSSAGVAGLLGWENRHVLVHVRVAHHVWTTHLYTVLTTGALLACWFLLGASFIQCRLAERRARRQARQVNPARSSEPRVPVRSRPASS